jgi:4-amino-4-deoxy-L-arabinose transferase-like glycosyltransferase
MMTETSLESLARGWRGRLFAALVAILAGLPGALALPPLDRDESAVAQTTAQMLETHDLVGAGDADARLGREPVAIHWLQAASVSALSSAEARRIWAYRVPSLLGAGLAAAAAVWGAGAFFDAGVSLIAGLALAAGLLLSTEASIAATDAVLCGAVTLTLAALAQVYAAWRRGERARRRVKLLFWLGLSLAILTGGAVGPVMAVLTGLGLWAWDRRAPWVRELGWAWGLILVAAVVGPWTIAITVQTDGGVWTQAAHDLLWPKAGRHPPPGVLALIAPLLSFPTAALLPAAAVGAWRRRATPGVRFALCWLAPAWLVFETAPSLLTVDPLPAYPALAWLSALAFAEPMGPSCRRWGAALSILTGVAWAGLALVAARLCDGGAAMAGFASVLALAAGAAGAAMVTWRWRWSALAGALVLGVGAHAALAGGVAPGLQPLWLSRRAVGLLDSSGLNPRDGLAPGPVAVVGYAEPSLVFQLGTETELGDVSDAAEAISEGRPVVVEARQDPAFRRELAGDRLKAHPVGSVAGIDYSTAAKDVLIVYRSDSPPPVDADLGSAP